MATLRTPGLREPALLNEEEDGSLGPGWLHHPPTAHARLFKQLVLLPEQSNLDGAV